MQAASSSLSFRARSLTIGKTGTPGGVHSLSSDSRGQLSLQFDLVIGAVDETGFHPDWHFPHHPHAWNFVLLKPMSLFIIVKVLVVQVLGSLMGGSLFPVLPVHFQDYQAAPLSSDSDGRGVLSTGGRIRCQLR